MSYFVVTQSHSPPSTKFAYFCCFQRTAQTKHFCNCFTCDCMFLLEPFFFLPFYSLLISFIVFLNVSIRSIHSFIHQFINLSILTIYLFFIYLQHFFRILFWIKNKWNKVFFQFIGYLYIYIFWRNRIKNDQGKPKSAIIDVKFLQFSFLICYINTSYTLVYILLFSKISILKVI